MKLDLENHVVILERKNCNSCDKGTVPKEKWRKCEKCKGTGKRGNGRCRNCTSFGNNPGLVRFYDHDDRETCDQCAGNYVDLREESLFDSVDATVLPIRVVRNDNRARSWNEEHLGFGSIYTVTDYNRHKNQTDEELIASESKGHSLNHVQAIKLVRSKDNPVLCDEIVIETGDGGYRVMPNWEGSNG